MSTVDRIALADLTALCAQALVQAGAAPDVARLVGGAIARAEAEGNTVCGLHYLTIFCAHLRAGKVNRDAAPRLVQTGPAALCVDADHGFAQPAFALGLPALIAAARETGIAGLGIQQSYNALALSHPVAEIAAGGLIGLGVAHSPASVALPGVPQRIFGTNPIAFAVPGSDGPLLIVDQSTSAVTKTEVAQRRSAGQPLEPGWAQDRDGQPTLDAAAALEGAILPNGGRKGGYISLLVEILAAALTGATPSIQAPSLGGMDGGPPGLGQFFIAIDPARFGAGTGFGAAAAALAATMTAHPGQRLPGARRRETLTRAQASGVAVDAALLSRVRDLL